MKIAVLIPVYNDPLGLLKTLHSLSCSNSPFFVLIVNDGSDIPVMPDVPLSLNMHELKLSKNSGIEEALNVGLEYLLEKDFEYIARLDSGDTIYPDRFSVQYEFLENNPSIGVVGSFIDVVDENGNYLYQQKYPISHDEIYKGLFYQNQICHPAVMFRTSLFKDGTRYPTSRPAAEDYALFRLLSKKTSMANIPRSLISYQVTNNSISTKKRITQCLSRLKIQLDNKALGCVHFYIGALRTLILLLLPRWVSICLKKMISRQ